MGIGVKRQVSSYWTSSEENYLKKFMLGKHMIYIFMSCNSEFMKLY